ncbi:MULTISPECIES: XrtA/PEP-CTERM system amidotransferase [unclassified Janthinobacterium]|uniref:XrtA/PEP-CTERM system amidotransferase n=1 Tax=unclassified Janthinobacterium TaxID=2610881 RepID=UPI00161FBF6B|nr:MULTISPECIES: XrtA/PEP-CTERM system amidotransferase [unclassified Janthinobacterium]MBB5606509.1 asparagine synthase (glutamine-hydrolyzing) [Janthinobacterium sp. S3T4]MBB5611619.1 asparagine synthase (glutamine-hydrolyzing) [Janthinobacterium sp. S3M3]
MCGIVGIFDLQGQRDIDALLLLRMNHSLRHRGPDEDGLHREPGLGLGHRRLSVIDLASGQQPLFNADRSVAIVFNGEIYNYRLLMAELRQFGHVFRTNSDTEVIVHAWEQWGEQCVQRLRGMFAFALWDRRRHQLFLARDRLGVKPLYYGQASDGTLLFGSELKALLAHPAMPRTLDPLAVEDYFAYGYVPEPRSIFQHALKLPPGHTLSIRAGQPLPAPRQYWDVPFTPHAHASEAQAGDELLARLREAVRIRMVAEVPLGAFLSGGVDSSAVVAMMAGASASAVNTCSIAFGDPAFDETRHAELVARRYGTQHHTLQAGQDDFQLIDLLANLYDEPFADSSAMPTYRVCQLARQRVTVALSGDGGDESLAGYRRYRLHTREEKVRRVMDPLLPASLRQSLFGTLGRLYPKADWAPRFLRAKTTFEGLARDTTDAYFHSVSILGDAMRARLFSSALRHQLQGYRAVEVLRRHAAASPAPDALSQVQYLDLKTYLPGDILTKVDRASMAHALEVRSPLLDHELVAWMSGLPAHFKLHCGEGKYLFKKALRPMLPDSLLYRQKMGFSVPLASWLRGPLRQRLQDRLLSPTLAQCGLFEMDYVRHLIEQHASSRRDYSAPLWSLLMFEAFLRQVLPAAATPAIVVAPAMALD